ncbi:MAG: hypothetical protein WDN00_05845 [Limisphaerales bacterium]
MILGDGDVRGEKASQVNDAYQRTTKPNTNTPQPISKNCFGHGKAQTVSRKLAKMPSVMASSLTTQIAPHGMAIFRDGVGFGTPNQREAKF